MKLKMAIASLALSTATVSLAQPGGWFYLWKNTADGRTECSQTSLGPNWAKSAGPFEDADCKIPQKD